jgi:hypothetical protein
MDLGKVGYVGVERINLAEGTYEWLLNTVSATFSLFYDDMEQFT